MTLYKYKIETECDKFNDGKKEILTYEKMHDNRTKDKIGKICCVCCMPPKDVTLKLISQTPAE